MKKMKNFHFLFAMLLFLFSFVFAVNTNKNVAKPKKIVLVLAHPSMKKSKSNNNLLTIAKKNPALEVIDLYAKYENFPIGEKLPLELLQQDQKTIQNADILIFQFPFYWFSAPALLKKWQDEILMRGWSHMGGEALKGKKFALAITLGEPKSNYSTEKLGHTVLELLAPYRVMANYLGMQVETPFLQYDTYAPSEETLQKVALEYQNYLISLQK